MKNEVIREINTLIERYPQLSNCQEDVIKAFELIKESYLSGGKVLVCGNGGSAADSEHIVGELMKCFKKKRPISEEIKSGLRCFKEGEKLADCLEGSLPAISLTSHLSLSTAYSNDTEPSAVFAQQLFGLGKKGDTFIAISTSGNSKNCVYACIVARTLGLKTICLTGKKESRLSALSDVSIRVPETETYKVQELHLPVYHTICAMLEEEFF